MEYPYGVMDSETHTVNVVGQSQGSTHGHGLKTEAMSPDVMESGQSVPIATTTAAADAPIGALAGFLYS